MLYTIKRGILFDQKLKIWTHVILLNTDVKHDTRSLTQKKSFTSKAQQMESLKIILSIH